MNNNLPVQADTSTIFPLRDIIRSNGGKSSWLDRWAAKQLLLQVGNPPLTLVLPDGTLVQTGDMAAKTGLLFHDRAALFLLLINPEYYFGELYAEGRIEVDGSLTELLCLIYRSLYTGNGLSVQQRLSRITNRFVTANTCDKARSNIQHHYDIGNNFYEKWLDPEMQYTCAYFAEPDFTLDQAQLAKLQHVCRKLMLKPGQTVVEAGCGWGGLARFMAKNYGVTVKAYNISREQIVYARQRALAEGLQDKIEYIEDDYRNIQGEYDAFVSVGMLEHIGIENYRELGSIINRCLKQDGIGLLHSIGFNHPGYLNAWIEKRIFPGACPAAISQMMDIFERQNFSILDIENLRLHYARTLEHWLLRFNNNLEQIRLDSDEEFIRAWRLYLSGSISAFKTGNMQLFQVVFAKVNNNALPWTRAHLYVGAGISAGLN